MVYTDSPPVSTTKSPEAFESLMEFMTDEYYDLVEDGGRPLFAIDLLDQVADNPGEYRDTLLPYAIDPDEAHSEDWKVFCRQNKRWREFRDWQRNKRNAPNNDSVSKHAEEAKMYLESQGFTQPFQLEEDPASQDPWTTWIEYSAFECCWLRHHVAFAERLRTESEKEWPRLVQSGFVKENETPESVRSSQARIAREEERSRLEKVLDIARTTQSPVAISKLEPEAYDDWKDSLQHSLQHAEESLRAFKKQALFIENFVYNKADLDRAEKDVRLFEGRVRYLLQQPPMIEAEEKQHKLAEEGHPITVNGKKRARDELDEEEYSEPDRNKRIKDGEEEQGGDEQGGGEKGDGKQCSEDQDDEQDGPAPENNETQEMRDIEDAHLLDPAATPAQNGVASGSEDQDSTGATEREEGNETANTTLSNESPQNAEVSSSAASGPLTGQREGWLERLRPRRVKPENEP